MTPAPAPRSLPRLLPLILGCVIAASAGAPLSARAEDRVVRDDRGRAVLEVRDDGTRVVHRYGQDGRLMKSEESGGRKVELQGGAPAPEARRHRPRK